METKMKVAHFSFKDTFGAAGAAYDLHCCMLNNNIESLFFVKEKTRNDDTVIELGNSFDYKERLYNTINKLYFLNNRSIENGIPLNFGYEGIEIDETIISMLKDVDIIHLHWIVGFLSPQNIEQLSKLCKKIVWTMHDFQPFTGACHYPVECIKYMLDCSDCEQLKENNYNITKYLLKLKKMCYGNNLIHVVVASKWLEDIVKNSAIFGESTCNCIPIGIDTEAFYIKDKKSLRQSYGFRVDEKIILIGAQSLQQNTKGYSYLENIIEILKGDKFCNRLMDEKKIHLLTFGNGEIKLADDAVKVTNMGFISNREELCKIYNLADVFIFPSIQETFGMAAVEAMACGVPVVAFDNCAMHEVIEDNVNGCKTQNCEEMAAAIIEILSNNRNFEPKRCRERIINKYSLICETNNMIHLYESILTEKKENSSDLTDHESGSLSNSTDYEPEFKINEFIYNCAGKIALGAARNQSRGSTIEEMIEEYSPFFCSPEQKVRHLIKNNRLNVENVYVYGAGTFGKRTISELKQNNISVKAVWDTNSQLWGSELEDIIIEKPQNKTSLDDKSFIIIIAVFAYSDIREILVNLRYTKNKDFF